MAQVGLVVPHGVIRDLVDPFARGIAREYHPSPVLMEIDAGICCSERDKTESSEQERKQKAREVHRVLTIFAKLKEVDGTGVAASDSHFIHRALMQ